MPKVIEGKSELTLRNEKRPGLHAAGGVPGLYLQVAESRATPGQINRAWVLRVKVGDRRRDIGLGGYPSVSLAKARSAAVEARATIRAGVDPVAEKLRTKSLLTAADGKALTFEAAAIKYLAVKSKEWANVKHGAQWYSTLKAYAYPKIGTLDVDHIERRHVLDVLNQVIPGEGGSTLWEARTETAQRLRGRIEAVLAWATVEGRRTGENPARWKGNLELSLAAPRKVTKPQHHAAVPLDRAAEAIAAIRSKEGTGARALEFVILTAARSGEARGAQWAEIDLEGGLWTVPAGRMKAGREHRVALSNTAVDLLRTLQNLEGNPYVFPSLRGKAATLSDMTLTKAMRDLGYTETVHGWRSTFRDWAAERTNYPGEMAEMALAHTVANKVEAAYRRGDMLEKRRAMMEAWAQFLTVRGTVGGRVVSLRPKAA